jgi:hypothetical protein
VELLHRLFFVAFTLIIRQTVATDSGGVYEDIPITDGIIHISLNYLDKRPPGAHYDAHMVRPIGTVTEGFAFPGIEDDISGQRMIAVVLFPAV